MAAACQPALPTSSQPTVIPFPTVTVGRAIRGVLATPESLLLDGGSLSNPATAIAAANQPTATPNYTACPQIIDTQPGGPPATARDTADSILAYLTDGGAPDRLQAILDEWNLLGEQGLARADLDLTGEGVPEVITSYVSADGTGALLIAGCANGQYIQLFQISSLEGTAPEIITAGDMNFDQQTDILYSILRCEGEDICEYQTQLITWSPLVGRFVSLLSPPISSTARPEIRDIDNDQVWEIIVRLRSAGNSETGPLRTGVNIYDWNGAAYLLSIAQPDPPRFTIQIVHEADRAFARREMENAIALYTLALDDETLEPWHNDDPFILRGYILYRLLLASAYVEDANLLGRYQQLVDAYPEPGARPVYVEMGESFWNALQVTNNLHSACLEVIELIGQRADALDLINRYGSRSPTYVPTELCPF